MASNFDFLKEIDKELFEDIEDAQRLFRDEYFNQSMVQIRVFGEKMAKKLAKSALSKPNDPTDYTLNMTFDDILNCLKDRVKSDREKEFVEDLFFIKKEGNKCAHGEDTSPSTVLESIKRAYEASINYALSKNFSKKINKLRFDDTLLITGKPLKENTLVQKYVELAEKNTAPEVPFKKQPNPKKLKVKEKIKEARKNLREKINKKPKINKKTDKKQKKNPKKSLQIFLFAVFTVFALVVLYKFIF